MKRPLRDQHRVRTGWLDPQEATRLMRVYFALVHKDADSAFGLSFPDMPEVYSAADEEADLIDNAIESLRLHGKDAT
jgi:predicted RNase H-like HicB family nuclease